MSNKNKLFNVGSVGERDWRQILNNIKQSGILEDEDLDLPLLESYFLNNNEDDYKKIKEYGLGLILLMWLDDSPSLDRFQSLVESFDTRKIEIAKAIFNSKNPRFGKEYLGESVFCGLDHLIYCSLYPNGFKIEESEFKKKVDYYQALRNDFVRIASYLCMFLEDDEDPYSKYLLMLDDWVFFINKGYTDRPEFDFLVEMAYQSKKAGFEYRGLRKLLCEELFELFEKNEFSKIVQDKINEIKNNIK
ncbi:hypothetical protein [Pleionea sediminis]|uniref:hypothetical protein n=1 Tax=Pleionea sediminis TaxID=2569479 RepID=UPI001184C4AC|nr:hypothetical protein [Pleionea sediminis]